MNEASENVGSVEDSLVVAFIVAAILLALFCGGTVFLVTVVVILVLGPGYVVVAKMLSFIKNIASGTGKFLIRVANFVFSKPAATTNGSGWGVDQKNPAENNIVGTAGFTAGGNIVGDPTLEAVNATTVSAQVHIGEVSGAVNYTASFPLGDPFQGPSYLLFGPLDGVKYTPFWLPVVEASEQTNATEEQKYLKLCPYSNPLYKEPNGLAGNSYANPLIVKYDNSKNTPQYNYYGYVDSDENAGIGSAFGNIANGSFALDDAALASGSIDVAASTTPDVANAGAVRLASNNAVWIKDMRTGEIRLVPFQTLNGELRTSAAETSLKYEYTETTETSGWTAVKDDYGNPRMATTTVTDPKTGAVLATRLYPITSQWTVKTGGTAEVSAVLNLGFGLSPVEGYVLTKRTGLLINQDKIYAVPQLEGKFTVSGGYADPADPSKAKGFSYYHESPGAGIVIFNLRSTGSDALVLEADKKAYYAQQEAWSMDQFNAWWDGELKNGRGVTDSNKQVVPKIYNDFWVNIGKSEATKPDFLIKETNEQFLVSMEYKPFTGDMIKYWAGKMPGFTAAKAGTMGTASFTQDTGAWGVQNVVGEDGSILSKVFVPALTTVTLPSGTTSSFLSKDTPADSITPADFNKLYFKPGQDGIDAQGFNSRVGVKGLPNSSADSGPGFIHVGPDVLNTGKIYADPFKSMPESFISRFSNFNPFTAFTRPNNTISTPLFAFESGVETYVGVSSAEYTQFATYKTDGLQAGYLVAGTGQKGTITVKAGDRITDLATGAPVTEVVTLPAIKLPWGPNPISSAEVVLPLTNEELSKDMGSGSKLGGEAMAFYQKIAGLTNDGTENLDYLPLMDKTKLQNAQDRTVYPLYAEGTKFYLSEFVKDTASGSWRFNRDFVEPSQTKADTSKYRYIVTPKLPDDFAIFTKYIAYSEGVDFNKTALDASGATTGSTVKSPITAASTSYESAFSYEVDPTTGLAKDKNKTDALLASLYKIKQGDMNPDGTLTTAALKKIEDPSKLDYISASKIGTFAIVNPSDYYQAPQDVILDVTSDNIVNIKVPEEGAAVTVEASQIVPPSESYLSVFKGFPQGSPLGSYSTCVTGAFGLSGDYQAATGVSFHAGIDLSTGGVSQPIYSTLNGVIKLGSTVNGGNVIEIWSTYTGADGKEYFVRVRFCHTASSVLSDGDQVKPGDLVGYSGNSGTPFGGMGVASYAYHLHYEIRISSVYADLMNSTKSAKNPLMPEFGISGTRICY